MDINEQQVRDLLVGDGSYRHIPYIHTIHRYFNSITQAWRYMICVDEQEAARFTSASIVEYSVVLWNESEGVTPEGHRFLENFLNKEVDNEPL